MVEDAEYPENLFYHENKDKKDLVENELKSINTTIKDMELMMNEMHMEILSLKKEVRQKN